MTGYARAQGADERRRWVWEARSVNGRNLEVRCRVPQGFDRLENPARTAVGGQLKRGNVSLILTITSERQAKPLRINRALLAELGVLVEEVRKSTGAAAPSADGLLRVRGVIEEEDEGDEDEEALAALDKALIAHARRGAARRWPMRAPAEGKALARVIDGHVDEIEGLCQRAAERALAQIGMVRARFDEPARRAAGARAAAVGGALRPGSGAAGRQGRRARGARPADGPHRPGAQPAGTRRGRTIRSAASSISSARSSTARPTRCARSRPTSS